MNSGLFLTALVNAPFVDCQDLATSKILKFSEFKDKWHYGQGKKFTPKILQEGLNLVRFLKDTGFQIIDAFPGFSGELRITTYPFDYYFEFTLEETGVVTFVIDDVSDEEVFRGDYDLETLKSAIKKIKDALSWSTSEYSKSLRKWSTSEFSQSIIGKKHSSVSTIWHLKTPPVAEAYQ